MDPGEELAFRQIVQRVISDKGPEQHLHHVLSALKLIESGPESFATHAHEYPHNGSLDLRERILRDLEPVPGAELLCAVVRTGLIGEYAQSGECGKAIEVGKAALPHLASDRRLAYIYAACLHDVGAAMFQSGRKSEGLAQMVLAVSIYDTLPNRSRGEGCRQNLRNLRDAFQR